METKVVVLGAVAVLAAVLALTEGKGCCAPDQWQGAMGSVSGFVYKKRPGSAKGITYTFYDATNKRVASFANYTMEHGKVRSYKIVKRYGKKECEGEVEGVDCGRGRMYVVDLETKKCYRKKLWRPFRKACIPDKAKETGDFYMGAGNATLAVRGYFVEFKKRGVRLNMEVTVTQDGCIPVGELTQGVAKGVPMMETVGFADIKPGVKDPTVFDIPKECDKAEPGLIMDALDREYSVLHF